MTEAKTVLVTGVSGYISSWVTRYLLQDGHRVRGTVRSLTDASKLRSLRDLQDEFPGKLELFEAELLTPGSFATAVQGCDVVIHMASPFRMRIRDPLKDLVDPAVKGTRNVLEQASKTSSVKRVVLTSSVAAIMGDAKDAVELGGVVTENDWNTTSSLTHQAYCYSKTVAERTAWEIAERQDQWDLVTINPAFVIGPSLTARVDSQSITFVRDILSGAAPMLPAFYLGFVDVRDVARAHIEAAMRPGARGRHIISNEVMSFLQCARLLKPEYDAYPLPRATVSKWLFYVIGKIRAGYTPRMTKLNYGIKFNVDNRKSIAELGIQYRTVRQSMLDHAAQLIHDGLVRERRGKSTRPPSSAHAART